MKHIAASTVVLLLLSMWLPAIAAESGKPDTPIVPYQVYPWSDDSELVRIDKRLLSEIPIRPVTVTNFDTMQFVLTDEFVGAFKLTRPEVDRVSRAITNAQHEYRTVLGKHLELVGPPVDGPAQPGLAAGERFTLRLIRFPEEAGAIRKKLEDAILSALGEQRSRFFWENGWLSLESDMNTFSKPSMFTPTSIVFSFPASNPGRVDLQRVGSGGSDGRTYGEFLDRYAPEAIRPVIARWRREAAENAAKKANGNPAPHALQKPVLAAMPANADHERPSQEPASGATANFQESSPWTDAHDFIDLPKKLIPLLKVPGLALEEEISPECAALFGLTSDEQKSVQSLYNRMRVEFENVERAHFQRTEPGKNNFVLKAFPEKSAAIKNEWANKLNELLGRRRGELLDQSIRIEFSYFDPRMIGRTQRRDLRMALLRDPYVTWLHRGTNETMLSLTIGLDSKGRVSVRHFEEHSGGKGGRHREGGVPDGAIPKQWRHLLPPDVVGLPSAL